MVKGSEDYPARGLEDVVWSLQCVKAGFIPQMYRQLGLSCHAQKYRHTESSHEDGDEGALATVEV